VPELFCHLGDELLIFGQLRESIEGKTVAVEPAANELQVGFELVVRLAVELIRHVAILGTANLSVVPGFGSQSDGYLFADDLFASRSLRPRT
jgi:hypothetical protein